MSAPGRTRLRRKLLAGGAAGGVCALVYGCSLGLDPSKIGATPGTPDSSLPPSLDASTGDSAPPGLPDSAPAAEAEAGPFVCATAADCTSTNGCLVGSCSDAGACSFAVCPTTSACQGSTCTAATSTCTSPATYGFQAALVDVTQGPVGCGGSAASCIAAAYPFVFVGTTNGVVAFAENDPSNPSPPSIVVSGIPFVPAALTAMGSRVYFIGPVQGTGPSYREAIAWLDVPTSPLVTSLQATTAYTVLSVSAVNAAWATTDGSLFLSNNDTAQLSPIARVTPPLTDGTSVSFAASPGVPAGARGVIASGSRVVMAHWVSGSIPYETNFSFETGAGTPTAQNAGDQPTLPSLGATWPQWTFAQGSDGSVLWGSSTPSFDDAGSEVANARVSWLVASGAATQFAPTQHVDVETYSPPVPYGTAVVGPVAWIDSTTAVALAATAGTVGPGNAGSTTVHVAVNAPTPKLLATKHAVIPQSVGQVGAAASGGFAYVLASGVSGAPSCSLYVFSPGCGP